MFDVFKHDISEDIALEHLTSKFYSVLKKLVVIAKKKRKKPSVQMLCMCQLDLNVLICCPIWRKENMNKYIAQCF